MIDYLSNSRLTVDDVRQRRGVGRLGAAHWFFAHHRLGEAATHQPIQRLHERQALVGGQDAEDVRVDLIYHRLGTRDDVFAGVADGDDARATVGGRQAALGQAGPLEVVHGEDHRRL